MEMVHEAITHLPNIPFHSEITYAFLGSAPESEEALVMSLQHVHIWEICFVSVFR